MRPLPTTAKTSDAKAKVRINVLISQEAHEALLRLAGHRRHMGLWLERAILESERMAARDVLRTLQEAHVMLERLMPTRNGKLRKPRKRKA